MDRRNRKRGGRPKSRRPCTACGELTKPKDLARAPCYHEYCRKCLESSFLISVADTNHFPPRCCRQDIPIADVRRYLTNECVRQFEQKAAELATPNRTYCHRPTCSAFIPAENLGDGVAHCPDCAATTCMTCKKESHSGECPVDFDLERVLRLGRERGWQRCPLCGTMVELYAGCSNIK
ncbi:hypothetical protein GGR50DRAFT_222456 [Xylaria sp. CBS 124048]|nr:hypothetical protein GGR50DRAFT_222456 [Xylaria sp. CBS 124048]